jgi:hypothetical protein
MSKLASLLCMSHLILAMMIAFICWCAANTVIVFGVASPCFWDNLSLLQIHNFRYFIKYSLMFLFRVSKLSISLLFQCLIHDYVFTRDDSIWVCC